ncbi:MAG: hypothetical protein HW405_904 [Candidatus Berkelbacteria bacterium]|nr:hypothetical protein [Candidatus Berkelbacteria bacterium]
MDDHRLLEEVYSLDRSTACSSDESGGIFLDLSAFISAHLIVMSQLLFIFGQEIMDEFARPPRLPTPLFFHLVGALNCSLGCVNLKADRYGPWWLLEHIHTGKVAVAVHEHASGRSVNDSRREDNRCLILRAVEDFISVRLLEVVRAKLYCGDRQGGTYKEYSDAPQSSLKAEGEIPSQEAQGN